MTRIHLKFLYTARSIMMILIVSLLLLLIIFFILLLLWSPGKPKPFVDANGMQVPNSISEKIFIDINNSKQGMFIKGKDKSKPVLLYVHGGMPDYFLTQKYPTGIEDDFVVVWWEQRGSGISYHPDISQSSIEPEQLVVDLIAVTKYLQQRFQKEKIYLMGHSGGTFIATQAAAKAPELYHAYLGMAQMSNQLQSEILAYEYMLKQFKADGNKKMVQKLEAAPVTLEGGTPKEYLAIRDKAMHSLGIGTMHNMHSVITGIFLTSLQFKEYTVKEKINLWRAKAGAGVSIVWNTILKTDFNKTIPELKIPVYFFEGIYDYTCSYTEAKIYFDNLKSPLKGFYTFKKSAHSPLFEEPEKMQQILREDVLNGRNNLADKN
jgi:pimeloyl-ACP methyl ester carboxylesterase